MLKTNADNLDRFKKLKKYVENTVELMDEYEVSEYLYEFTCNTAYADDNPMSMMVTIESMDATFSKDAITFDDFNTNNLDKTADLKQRFINILEMCDRVALYPIRLEDDDEYNEQGWIGGVKLSFIVDEVFYEDE